MSEAGSQLAGEVGLGVSAGDAERIDGGLVVRVVLDELACELGLREGCLLGRGRTEGEELALLLDGFGEGLLEPRASRMIQSKGSELAACVAVTRACKAKGAVETRDGGERG